jgi:hypothetical protein
MATSRATHSRVENRAIIRRTSGNRSSSVIALTVTGSNSQNIGPATYAPRRRCDLRIDGTIIVVRNTLLSHDWNCRTSAQLTCGRVPSWLRRPMLYPLSYEGILGFRPFEPSLSNVMKR